MAALRVAITGIENSHVDHMLARLTGEATPIARAVAVLRGEPDRTDDLVRRFGVTAYADVEELLDVSDALIVSDRDGRLHEERALPFVEAGRPVWVDKPLACTVDAAERIISAAQRSGSPLMSGSALRFLPAVGELRAALAGIGELRAVLASGPADPDSPHAGIFFYGIHSLDLAQSLLPAVVDNGDVDLRIGDVDVRRIGEVVQVTADADNIAVVATLVAVRPGATPPPFHLTAIGSTGVITRELRVAPGYFEPSIDAFLTMLGSGEWPVPAGELLAPIARLEAVAAALSR